MKSEWIRDGDGRFAGFRCNTEDVPRLPVFPARWALEDGCPYFVFWESRFPSDGPDIALMLKLVPLEGLKVRLEQAEAAGATLYLEERPPLPSGGRVLVYICPWCSRGRRYLYLYRAWKDGRGRGALFRSQPLCRECAGLMWSSQGRYRGRFARMIDEPYPRNTWDPQAVSGDEAREIVAQLSP